MEKYKNLGGDSGVFGYKIDDDRIVVKFNDGGMYLYTYMSAGKVNVEEMKKLAKYGQGLNTYINKNVKKLYAEKLV